MVKKRNNAEDTTIKVDVSKSQMIDQTDAQINAEDQSLN